MIGAPKIIQTREDLENLRGTAAYAAFVQTLKQSMCSLKNIAQYPPEYDFSLLPGAPGYIAPEWIEDEDLTTITRFGFSKAEVLAL